MGTVIKNRIKERKAMKKRILAIILCTALCLGVTGCSTDHLVDGENNFLNIDNEYMKMHKLYDENDGCIIAYDEYTKVMYLCAYGNSAMAITPIYNSDGTVKLYEEDEADITSTEKINSPVSSLLSMVDDCRDEINKTLDTTK